MTILVTGGCGFIGSNFVRYMLRTHPGYRLLNLDALTYAGNPENLEDLGDSSGYRFLRGDIRHAADVRKCFEHGTIEVVVNFAAESHVDRSITGPALFVETNVAGTGVLLDAAREHGVKKFIQVSTDEVYGSLGPQGLFTETTPLHPNSPYSASKASADLLALSYHHTFDIPVVVTRCSNNYGPYQFPEKLIPLMIANAIDGKPLPVYGDGLNVRDWLFVTDHCAAIDRVLHDGKPGEVYNIGGNAERKNVDIVRILLETLGKGEDLIRFVKDRPGHDRRYAIDAGKIRNELGWLPAVTFEEGIRATVDWYRTHEPWWRRVMSGEYQKYYRAQYEER